MQSYILSHLVEIFRQKKLLFFKLNLGLGDNIPLKSLKLLFKVIHKYENDLDLHKLVISNVTMNDAGEYKCQVENTNPKLEQVISKVIKCQCNKYTIYLIFACYKISKALLLSIKRPKRPQRPETHLMGPENKYLSLIAFSYFQSKVSSKRVTSNVHVVLTCFNVRYRKRE